MMTMRFSRTIRSVVAILVLGLVAVDAAPQQRASVIGSGVKRGRALAGGGGTALGTYLVACWEQQEGATGTITDSCNAHNATEVGSTIGSGVGPNGSHLSRDYDDNNLEYGTTANHADFQMGAEVSFCLETHVIMGSVTGSRGFLSKYGAAGSLEYSLLYNGSSERFQFVVSNDGTATASITATASGKPVVTTWYHLIACHSAGANQLTLYRDGSAVAESPVAHTTGVVAGTNAAVQLGARNSTSTLEGRMAYTRIYKGYVLTPTDVTFLYNGGTGKTKAEVDAYVP